MPGTVPNDHVDRGCRITKVYGTDYRCTTMYGLVSNRFLEHRWDIPMAYATAMTRRTGAFGM